MDEMELRDMMYSVQFDLKGPVAIRYPRGNGSNLDWKRPFSRIDTGKGRLIKKGTGIAVLTVGPIGTMVKDICEDPRYADIGHYDMRFVKPLDKDLLDEIFRAYSIVITLEDGAVRGGFGQAVLAYRNSKNADHVHVEIHGLPDQFVDHGSLSTLKQKLELDQEGIQKLIERMKNGKIY
jgi:1-deoxy-D-xylulose-5-phosphate synthase